MLALDVPVALATKPVTSSSIIRGLSSLQKRLTHTIFQHMSVAFFSYVSPQQGLVQPRFQN
jgi:hypothetical protein